MEDSRRKQLEGLAAYLAERENAPEESGEKEAAAGQAGNGRTAEGLTEKCEPDSRDLKNMEALLRDLGESFHGMLFRKIREKGLKDSAVYKKADIDRRLFSRIRTSPAYHPRKDTVLCLCLALELPIGEAEEMLGKAGYALSGGSRRDLIIRYCIDHQIFSIDSINWVLSEYDLPLLGYID